VKWCDECANFKHWAGPDIVPPEDYNPCAQGHAMKFKTPRNIQESMGSGWGYYMPKCPDRRASSTSTDARP
jgi:hypothetical protein